MIWFSLSWVIDWLVYLFLHLLFIHHLLLIYFACISPGAHRAMRHERNFSSLSQIIWLFFMYTNNGRYANVISSDTNSCITSLIPINGCDGWKLSLLWQTNDWSAEWCRDHFLHVKVGFVNHFWVLIYLFIHLFLFLFIYSFVY
jgi:hypothetical protein